MKHLKDKRSLKIHMKCSSHFKDEQKILRSWITEERNIKKKNNNKKLKKRRSTKQKTPNIQKK